MGDKTLEIEVLQMFSRQARRALHDMATTDTDAVVAAAHRLKGAASAVGAFRVVAAAEALETQATDPSRRSAVSAAVVEAESFINKLCR
jgi:HPt (histidine-containing phosphotransfer) domain-containing protein